MSSATVPALATGLRERKKQRTRRQIAEAARALFRERGFDAVTVAEVAARAEVSDATVFNYFPKKEDLFFAGLEQFEEQLLDAIRERPPGESALAAFGRFLLDSLRQLSEEEAAEAVRVAANVVGESPALQAREREISSRYAASLAAVLAEERGHAPDDIEARVAAESLMAAHRAVLDRVRAAASEGSSGRTLNAVARSEATRALNRIEAGLGNYAIR